MPYFAQVLAKGNGINLQKKNHGKVVVMQFSYNKWFWVLMCFAAILLFFRIGAAPIYILDEAKNAQCAREMWLAGDWLVPTFNHSLRTDKPALHYWFMGLSYGLFGEGAAQARLFSAMLGLGVIWLTYWQVRRYAGEARAFFTTVVLALSPHFLFEFRLSVPDPYLIFFTTAGLFSGFSYLNSGSRKALLVCAMLLGIAVLAKGPVALALPGLTLFIYVLVAKKWQVFKDPYLLLALLLALGIAFPWYYAVHLKTGGAFTRGFFLDHNLNRFSSEKEGHGGPFFITPIIVLVGLLPFSLLIINALRRKLNYWKDPLFKFATIVVLVYVVFFSISSTKLPNYPMPCYPFAAILAGYFLSDVFERKQLLPQYNWWIWLILSLVLPVGAYFGIKAEPAVAHLGWVAFLLLPLAAGTIWAFITQKNAPAALKRLGMAWVIFAGIFLWVGYPLLYAENPVTKMIPLISGAKTTRILYYKAYNPGFNFNLPANQMIIDPVENMEALVDFGTRISDGAANTDVFVISRLEFVNEFKGTHFKEIARQRDLFELPTTIIFKWEP
jgi:4-amino-4-deoxy-L-arabinose transferase-like glycosyltransferase